VVDLSLLCLCGHDRGTHAWTTHECLQDVHLTTACQCKTFVRPILNVAPDSPSRILRELRKQGRVDYIVVNRAASLYRVVAVRV
jgi:hypothetical protein